MSSEQILDVVETVEQLRTVFLANKKGIITIKPKVIFNTIEKRFCDPVSMNLSVPSSGIGSITLLEGAILIALIKLIDPACIFEFGTFLGYSTALFVRNGSPGCKVFSIDLGDVSDQYGQAGQYAIEDLRKHDRMNDDYLRYVQSQKGPRYIAALTGDERSRLTLLHGDSTKIDVDGEGLKGAVDLVFVDGGHDTDTIKSDTENAVRMLGSDGILIWHDFNSSIHSDVTEVVRNYAEQWLVLHVQNTMLAFVLFGKAKDLVVNE